MHTSKPVCFQCGESLPNTSEDKRPRAKQICGQCITSPPPFKQTIFAYQYAGHAAKLIQRFKFNQDLLLGHFLANAMTNALQNQISDMSKVAAIIAVPLHHKRLKTRGFNQAHELAKNIGKRLRVPVYDDYLVRTKATCPQTGLNKTARAKNIKGVFELNQKSNYFRLINQSEKCDETLILVDDVITTGATIREAAKQIDKDIVIVSVAKTS